MKRAIWRTFLALTVAVPCWAAGNLFGGIMDIDTTAKSLTTLCGLSTAVNARQLTVKQAAGNAATIYCGPSTVTNVPANARIQISGGAAYTWQPGASNVNTDDIYCVSSADNTPGYCDGVQ